MKFSGGGGDRHRPQSYLLPTVFCAGAALVCAAGWWYQTSVLRDLDIKIAANEERIRDFDSIKVQIEALRARSQELQHECQLIERPKREKTAGAAAGGAAAQRP